MKQVIQSARTGKLALKEVPSPKVKAGSLLVATRASLISAGTERMVVEFARKSLAGKAKARPDLVRKVLDKAKRDGLAATFRAVMARLDEPLPLGYSAAGEVVAVGAGLEAAFRVGQRVAVAGAGLANHSELNVVPRNLAVPLSESVPDEHACFGTLGSIALHGVRSLQVGLGDVVCVVGVGLVGQLAVQFLALQGARVIALDANAERLALAARLGAELAWNLADSGLVEAVDSMTGGIGCDAILICAATESNGPLETAAEIARDRARVVMTGKTGTEFPYAAFMKKELSVMVSRSYGPGRYDEDFEGRGVKYPVGFVRWTETENLAEVVRLMAAPAGRRLEIAPLISHRFAFDRAEEAYHLVTEATEPHLGVVLTYDRPAPAAAAPVFAAPKAPASGRCVLGVIGAGSFARTVLLPEFKRLSAVEMAVVATTRGMTADHARSVFGFGRACTDAAEVLADPSVNAVLIATRHAAHAELTARALEAGKAVLVEKPLAVDRAQLNRVIAARNASDAFLTVGFNRRFAPMIAKARAELARRPGAKVLSLRVNAGPLPREAWLNAAEEGGGRVIGEACHFIDLARSLVGSAIVSVSAESAAAGSGDDVAVSLAFADGSLANLVYTGQGDSAFSKERFECFAGGAVIAIDNFLSLSVTADGRTNVEKAKLGQDKGHRAEVEAFVRAVASGGPAPVDEAELIETSLATIAVLDSLREGRRVFLTEPA